MDNDETTNVNNEDLLAKPEDEKPDEDKTEEEKLEEDDDNMPETPAQP